jgi:hypothetical protein
MAFNTPLTHSENYVFGRGVCYFAPFDANSRPMGERDLGNVPGLTLTVTSEKAEHFSSRSGLRRKDLSVTISVAFDANVTIEDMSKENLALFVAGSVSTVTQAATPVTNERIYNAESGREYQLGTSTSNITGVRGVSSVTVKLYELANAGARANSTAYAVGDIFKSSTDVFIVTTAGTTAGSAPTYTVAAVGDATTDGTAVVKFLGTTAAFTLTTHYLLSTESARVGIVAGANLALACDLYTAVTDGYLSLNVDYTPAANTRQQITSSGAGAVSGQFRFVADNAEGDNRDLFISSCNLAADGELPFITESEVASGTFTLGVNERDSSTPQIIIDGRVAA